MVHRDLFHNYSMQYAGRYDPQQVGKLCLIEIVNAD